MALPTRDAICKALEDSRNILDPKLAGYNTIDGIMGPEFYPGGFCLVFPVINGSDKYAFRVWYTEIDGIQDRLAKISAFLAAHKSKYFVEFDFVPNGLRVDSDDSVQDIPSVRMKWVDGKNLSTYLEYIINESGCDEATIKRCISRLAENFLLMVQELHRMNVSHGDLQHGNILVDDNQEIVLVDYDSVYVPTFNGELQITSGMSAYQHPCRKKGQVIASARDDFFSERIIYLSLLALAEEPSLWNTLKDDEGEKDEYSLLLTDKDIENFTNCSLYSTFSRMKNPRILVLLKDLTDSLQAGGITNLIPIEELLVSKYDEQTAVTLLDEDDLSFFTKEPVRTYQSAVSIKETFDEAAAFDRYSQN